MQYPVAYQWAKATGKKFEMWLDEKMLKPLVPLFEAQECCEAVKLLPGIQHYGCGGQPWHFDLKTEDHLGYEIYHLGFRQFPQRQITYQCALDVPLNIDAAKLSEQSIFVEPFANDGRKCVLHGNFGAPGGGTPRFWRFLYDIREELERMFTDIAFVGPPEETARALEIYPKWRAFDDRGSFLDLAKFMAGASLVVGCGSSGVALAGALKVPCIRVHDPIGEAPKVIWSNLGENQLNDTEIGLRKSWPEFRDRWLNDQPVG